MTNGETGSARSRATSALVNDGGTADICLQSDDAALQTKGTELLQNWLQQVGCETPERQAVRVQLAEVLLTDVAQLSADF